MIKIDRLFAAYPAVAKLLVDRMDFGFGKGIPPIGVMNRELVERANEIDRLRFAVERLTFERDGLQKQLDEERRRSTEPAR